MLLRAPREARVGALRAGLRDTLWGRLCRMPLILELGDDERKRRSEAMRDLNRSGRRGKRRAKTDDERIRESLMQIVKTGTARQRLDATRELAALDERSPARRPDFEDMTPAELDAHVEGLVLRMVEHWASTRLLAAFGDECEKRGYADLFDHAVARNAA